MIQRLKLNEFTALPNATYEFCSGLNVILAENGKGKSHLLKLLYSLEKVVSEKRAKVTPVRLEDEITGKLLANFRPNALDRLIRRQKKRCGVDVSFDQKECLRLSFSTGDKTVKTGSTGLENSAPQPVFIPTRELLTLIPWFVPLYDGYHIEFEEIWRDTCALLSYPAKRGQRTEQEDQLLAPLEKALDGTVSVDAHSGKVVLRLEDEEVEMPLVAEGLRKIAMLARMVSADVLKKGTTLYWDEPEANLNPKYIRTVAECIWNISGMGVQVFVASHSVFLLKELYLLQQTKRQGAPQVKWFALAGPDAPLEVADELWDLNTFVAFEQETEQTDRLLEVQWGR